MTHKDQLNNYKKRATLILEFLISKSGKSVITDQLHELINTLFTSEDLKGLKDLNHELDRWGKELPKPNDSIELYSLLNTELDEDFESDESKKLKQILKTGIRSQEDYELVQDRANQIFQLKSLKKELGNLNALLLDYENHNTKL